MRLPRSFWSNLATRLGFVPKRRPRQLNSRQARLEHLEDRRMLDGTIEVENSSVREEAGYLVFTVWGYVDAETTVHYSTQNGTAVAGSDYQPLSPGTLSFNPGNPSAALSIAIIDDSIAESSETFQLTLSNPNPAATLTNGTGTIHDNEPTVFTVNDVTVTEGHTPAVSEAVFSVQVAKGDRNTNVYVYTTNNTAVAGQDFNGLQAYLYFGEETPSQQATVYVIGDNAVEGNEKYFVNVEAEPLPGADLSGIGTITNDDSLRLSIADKTVTEGNSGSTYAAFSVTLDAIGSQTVSVSYTTTAGSATAGSDFTPLSGTLAFSPGQTQQFISIPIIGDTASETTETFSLDLSSPVGALLADGHAVGTILDNDPPPVISLTVDNLAVMEGSIAYVPVRLSAPSSNAVSFRISTANGSASSTSVPPDYTAINNVWFTIAAGQTGMSVPVQTALDSIAEADETFTVNVNSISGASIADGQGIVTIQEIPTVSINDVTISEPRSGYWREAVFTVTISQPANTPAKVRFDTAGVTAVAGQDFTSTNGFLTFSFSTTALRVTVKVIGDSLTEPDETFAVNLTPISNIRIGDGQGVGTIKDYAVGPFQPAIVVTGADAGGGPTVKVRYATSGVQLYGFPAYDSTFTGGVRVATGDVNGDGVPDIITAPGNGMSPTIKVYDGASTPGTTPSVIREFNAYSASFNGGVFVAAADVDGDGYSDIITAPGTGGGPQVRVFSGQTGVKFLDFLAYPNTYTGGVRVSAGDFVGTNNKADIVTAPITTAQTTVRIFNPDTAETEVPAMSFNAVNWGTGPTVAAGDVNADGRIDLVIGRGGGQGPFVQVYDGSQLPTLSTLMAYGWSYLPSYTGGVRVGATDFNGDGRADVVAAIGAGAHSPQIVGILSTGAGTDQWNAYPGFNGGAYVEGSFHPVLKWNSSGGAQLESASPTVTAQLGAASKETIKATWQTANGTALAGTDYNAASGTLTFLPSQMAKNVTVQVINDLVDEGTAQTFQIQFASGGHAVLGAPSTYEHTILDDDPLATLQVHGETAAETDGNVVLDVTLTPASESLVTVPYFTEDDSATAGADFASASGTLTFQPYATLQTITVSLLDDLMDEPDETFWVDLGTPVNASLHPDHAGLVTLTDDDDPPVLSFEQLEHQVHEGEEVEITLVLSAPSQEVAVASFETIRGTAWEGDDEDYEYANEYVTFEPGETIKTIHVHTRHDSWPEASELFKVLLSPVDGLTVTQAEAIVVIKEESGDQPTDCNCSCGCTPTSFQVNQQTGNLRLYFRLADGTVLIYNSEPNPHPVITVNTVLETTPEVLKAELTLAGQPGQTVWYENVGGQITAGMQVQFVMQADASGLADGEYPWELTLTNYIGGVPQPNPQVLTGTQRVVNRTSSPFGNRWILEGLDALVAASDGVTLVRSNGNAATFRNNGPNTYLTPSGYTSTLIRYPGNGNYQLNHKGGGYDLFDASGRLMESFDRTANRTGFTYYPDGKLWKITDQYGRTTELFYSATNGLLEKIKDFALRETLFTYTPTGLLETSTLPDPDGSAGPKLPPVTTYRYDTATSAMDRLTDAEGRHTLFKYDNFRRIEEVHHPDGGIEKYSPVQTQGLVDTWAVPPDGTQSNPAPLRLRERKIGSHTAPGGLTTLITTDRFGYPLETSVLLPGMDPLVTTYVRDPDGRLLTLIEPDPDKNGALDGPLGPLETRQEFDQRGNLTQITFPNGALRRWEDFDPVFDLPGRFIDELGRITLYAYNSRGDLTSETQVVGEIDSPANGETDDVKTSYNYTPAPTGPGQLPGGLLESIVDPLGRWTEILYYPTPGPKFGQLMSITYASNTADHAVEWFDYDNYGNLTKQWFGGLPVNQVFATWYQYDLLGRLTAIAQGPNDGIAQPWLLPQQAFDYDRVNNLTYERHGTREIVMTYDPRNRLSTITGDADGPAGSTLPSVEERFYNVDGELEESRDAEDHTTNYGYDALGYLDLVLLPETPEYVRPEIHFVNGALGDVLSETDPRGYTTFYEYSPRRELAKVTTPDPDGPSGPLSEMISFWAFDEAGQLKDETHAGHNTHREYDALGRQISETNPRGYTRSWVYDKNSNVTQEIDEAGYVTQRFYDFRDRLKEVLGEDPDLEDETDFRPRTVYAYDTASRVTQETTYNNNLPRHTFFKYNALSLPTEITDAGNNLWKRSYDAAGNLIEELDPLNSKTTYEYDLLHRPTKRLDPIPDGPSGSQPRPETRWEYNLAGWLIREYDPLNRLTTFAHDNLGQVVTTIDNLGRTFHRKHDLSGNLVETTDQDGFVTQFEVDALNRLVKEIGADPDKIGSVDGPLVSPVRRWEYDEHGNVWKEYDPLNRLTEHHYNTMGQRTWTQLPDPQTIGGTNGPIYQWVYDAAGYLQNEIDPLSQGKNYGYDRLHRRTSAMDESGAVTYFAFDQAGNLKSLTDSIGTTTTWAHDALDRVTSETNEASEFATRTFHYDAAGRMDWIIDRNNRTREFVSDGLGRLTAERWLTGGLLQNTINYAYNAASELTWAYDSSTSYAFTYDALGRVRTVDNAGTLSMPQVVFTNEYDGRSNRTSVKAAINGGSGLVDDHVNSMKYDGLSRLTRIQQFDPGPGGLSVASKQVNFGYDPDDRVNRIRRYAITGDDLVQIQPHLVVDNTLLYDDLGRLETTSYATRSSTVLASYFRQYDALSRVTYASSQLPQEEINFGYNSTSQLTSAEHVGGITETYDFDTNGNRQSSHLHGSAYVTGPNNSLLYSDGEYDYLYDYEGNRRLATRTSTDPANDYKIEYTWDHRNRLTGLVFKNNAGTPTKRVEYVYDPFDRRIGKKLDATGDGVFERYEWYAYDGDHIALAFVDLDGAGSGGSSLTNRYLHGPAVDQILADEQIGGDVLYPLTDHLGTVRDLVKKHNTLGAEVVNHIRYDSFGNIVGETNAAIDHFFAFTGRTYDADARLYDYRARWYDPVIGRFLSEDPIGFSAGDANLQRYVGNNAPNFTDPSGLLTRSPGSHWVPFSKFEDGNPIGKFSSTVQDVFNDFGKGTLDLPYNHGNDTWNTVTHPKYNDYLEEELRRFIGWKKKSASTLSAAEAREFLNIVKGNDCGTAFIEAGGKRAKELWEKIAAYRKGLYRSVAHALAAMDAGVKDKDDLKRIAKLMDGQTLKQGDKLATKAAQSYYDNVLKHGAKFLKPFLGKAIKKLAAPVGILGTLAAAFGGARKAYAEDGKVIRAVLIGADAAGRDYVCEDVVNSLVIEAMDVLGTAVENARHNHTRRRLGIHNDDPATSMANRAYERGDHPHPVGPDPADRTPNKHK